ncbi:aspartyl/asparaginyl beta-hydroxylase domain-containing protein [Ulvibacter sp. MAR_2010_11]|uniref:aspartyl/asparaginyl beta-hydroxylase domain-containing protein n=1 Tax=Ulvibacter sp. MAR_2010_11 TaxID=1250229 RepID=UPI001E4C389C|nr:aspartyl/asparaginyl beta-hydroxylase domain-containing protein [Ulvibacter sp. MAR_2010_11]
MKPETLWSKHLIEPIGTPDEVPDFLPYEALQKCPYLLSILNTFECNKETFRIHILDPGAHIRPYRDLGCRLEDRKVRLHIPVKTDDGVQLLLNNNPVKMKAGECWNCNFHITHEIRNNSKEPRVHLIMDCIVNDWLKTLFKR